ncbi:MULTISPECIES: short-chain fatty acid transporter [Halomonadaceae]|jgi:short-chain fatty acids transporter|uniref:Short-chain fatty acids transporter n=1 Tax=Vreelandella aquamarina TaxID=77097 RepID=A0A1N6JL74_9GAMM|nr:MULTISPECIES: short-chain fatty acid transporter [Halomonas]MEE3267543.1 short-chain fatty acid transporter [Pseudomonadota bacterium]HAO02269.1 short-chain fatty acid transporter [Halomonas sp.]MCP1302489.1 short-chain fatty acid transporter [Halomonas sp. R1t8]MCP1329014.1 short-chain fatty acid transporter [Halomonas sp. R1t4]SIN62913.1 short-chain fatty acids transporter [Halomonas meridiana]|tara:strand:+ start:260 stop:1570 length:1311 start_codon:yes stop_codon:yes gene_type:complete
MLKLISKPAVKLVERYLPDPYIFVLLLTLIAAVAAIAVERQTPLAVLRMWGDGFWGLLTFSMQMLLVLVTGFMLASSPPVKRILQKIAGTAKSPGGAIILVTLVSLAASWINWGFGLVVGALFAKELARLIKVDYRLLVASAYSGFVVWHGGLAGSVPLTIATEGHFSADQIGVIGTGSTIFAFFNLAIVVCLFIAVPLVNRMMLPDEKDSVYVDPKLLDDEPEPVGRITRPAEKLENSMPLALLVGVPGLLFLLDHFLLRGGSLNLNVVNFMFLFLAIVLHRTPRNLLTSLNEAIKGGAGIVIQFPFYAGIMAIMVQSGLAQSMSEWLVSFATANSLPFWSFISAGIVNLFVPSGGGQWAVQAPVMLPAAEALGADIARVAMAVAWGDAWTNLLQPFWALPVLAIAGLKAKDIMGFCLIQLFITGIIISVGLVWF